MEPSELDRRISKLNDHYHQAKSNTRGWKELWSEIKEIGANFKGVRYPSKEERNEAWERFQGIIDSVKEAQDEERGKWDKKADRSSQLKDQILRLGEQGRPPNSFESAIGELIIAPFELLAEAVVDIATLGLLRIEIDKEKVALKAYSSNLHKAWNEFKARKDEMLGKDKHEVFETLREIQDELDAAWEAWKKTNDWYYEANRSAHKGRIEASIEKLESRLENLYSILSKKESHVSDLEDKRDSAWNDDFRERVQGWIEEENDKIGDIKNQISQVEDWLSEQRGKL